MKVAGTNMIDTSLPSQDALKNAVYCIEISGSEETSQLFAILITFIAKGNPLKAQILSECIMGGPVEEMRKIIGETIKDECTRFALEIALGIRAQKDILAEASRNAEKDKVAVTE